jgi:hypothetical protein
MASENASMVGQAFVTAGYNVEWFTLEEMPSSRNVVSVLDLDEPFFDNVSEHNFVAFRNFMAHATPKSILWLTQPTQMQCEDPRYSQTLGVARSMRIEFSLPFITFEMSRCDTEALGSLIRAHKGILSSLDSELEPDYEYSVEDDTVYTSRYYPTAAPCRQDAKHELPNLSKRLTIGTLGLLDTLGWKNVQAPPPGHGEIEVDVKFIGLNFRVGKTQSPNSL